MTRRSTSAAVGLVAGASLVLAGCSGSPKVSQPIVPPASVTAAPTPALTRFYSQKMDWKQCGDVECAKLTVPVDYAEPAGATIQLAISKVPATGTRQGSLLVNPGGPGGSGYDYGAAADRVVTPSIRKAYDVIGFDPRGVQRSDPIECVDNAQLDKIVGADPTPDTPAEEQTAAAITKSFGVACKKNAGALIGHVSTVEVAKDVDILRAAVGSPTLDYLGKSYGTLIGSYYAELFPRKVGRLVLDGVVPPDLTSVQVGQGQAAGFELATRSYVTDCVQNGGCPLGSTQAQGMAKIRSFLKQLDATPLPVTGQGDVTKLTEGWGSLGIAEAMYDKSSWPALTKAFTTAFGGDGNGLMALANSYTDRNSDGTYSSNLMQVNNAVNCLDQPSSPSLSSYEKDATTFSKTAPTWGRFLAWSGLTCGQWPIKATGEAHRIEAAGSGPILVVGTTRDPATPYAWSQRLATELKNGHLLTYVGDGHTAYGQSSCVNDAVDRYLLQGTVAPQGKRC